MENKEIRRLNLEALVRDEYKTIAALAYKIGMDPAYLSQILNRVPAGRKDTPRGMGGATARKIEEKCGMLKGWMDSLHDQPSYGYAIQEIMTIYDSLDERSKKLLMAHAKSLKDIDN